MNVFTKEVVQIIQSIPEGKVMTYGQIAEVAGNPRGARQVARILHTMSQKYQLPWHMVVNRNGEVTIQDEELKFTQLSLLKSEGIQLTSANRVPLNAYRFQPK